MTYLAKPKLHHPSLPRNALGFTRRDYEGPVSTLCAGCGHDSISAAIIQAFFELAIPPHRVAKLSGIGCSSKTPTYFLGQSHGFNSVHGRMPSVLTGANLANRDLIYLGISGDGDSASIGLGQFAHIMRRGVNMTYIVENNGVYGLTKGQFSASADIGTKAKRGEENRQPPVDRAILRLAYHELTSGHAPPKVVINEAVELAKKFGAEQSPAFINGVLDKLARQLSGAAAGEDASDEHSPSPGADGIEPGT